MTFVRDSSRLMQFVCALPLLLALAACGSGGSDGGGGTVPAATPLSGTFIDSPVQGLGYSTTPSGLSGLTNVNGQYNYMAGDTVTFNLYGRPLGAAVPAAPVVTALTVFNATSITDPQVVNLSQLLLTLGGIPAPGNPIQVPVTPPANFPTAINFSDSGFDTSFPGLTLVSETTATTHLGTSFKTLSVTIVNSGTVTSNPAGINCTAGTCSFAFVSDTAVTLTATGSGFTGWSGGCSGSGTCVVTVSADSAVTATFPVVPPPATLTILPNQGTGTGTVSCSADGGAFATCGPSYASGTALVIRAVANGGSTFAGWSDGSGNATSCNNTAVDCSITLTANSSVRANFALSVTLFSVTANTATSNGGGGSVSCSANGGAAGPCGSYPVGAAMVLTATPNSASNFTGWAGAGCAGTGTCSFTLTANTTVTANFNRPILTVVVNGTGAVSSTPAGINTCTTNCTAPFNRGTAVTLTATGTGFGGWSGGCTGTGACVVTVNVNTTVTATFGAVSSSASYKFVSAEGGSLMAIDPAAPTAPITVASGIVASEFVLSASYNAGTQTFTNVQASIETFVRNGSLWRVNSAKSAGVPGTPANPAVQISNEVGATSLCAYKVMQTGSTSTARIHYEFAGADGDCAARGDNISKLVPVLADSLTPPLTLPTGTRPTTDDSVIVDLATGQVVEIFLLDHANAVTLKRLDHSSNAITTIQANVGTIEFIVQDTSDRVFIRNNNTLYLYTRSSNTLTTLVSTATTLHCTNEPCVDGTHIYVFEDAGRVYRVPLTATSSADVVTLISSTATPLLELALTSSRIILHTGDFTPGSSNSLVSMPKAGGAQTTLVSPQQNFISIVGTAGNLLYYNIFPTSGSGTFTATVVQNDGVAVSTFANSMWNGIVTGNTFSVKTGDIGLSKIVKTALGPSLLDPLAGATVSVYEAANPLTVPISLGAVPTTTPSIQGLGFAGIADNILLGVGRLGPMFSSNAILFADASVPNSLVLVPLPPASWLFSGL
jgi:Divergent InlB B-repeat domain